MIWNRRKAVLLGRLFFAFFIFSSTPFPIHGQSSTIGWDLEPPSAQGNLSTEKYIYQNGLALTLQSILIENISYRKAISQLDSLLDELNHHSKDPDRSIYSTEIHLFKSVLLGLDGSTWTAAWQFRRTFLSSKQNFEKWPKDYRTYKTYGLLLELLDFVPEKYHFYIQLAGLEASQIKGRDLLNKSSSNLNTFSYEATLLANLIDFYGYRYYSETCNKLEKLQVQDPSLCLRILMIDIYSKAFQAEKALRIKRTTKEIKSPFEHYFIGQAYFSLEEWGKAEMAFKQFRKTNQNGHLIKASFLKSAFIEHISGDKTNAMHHLENIPINGKTLFAADQYALSFSSTNTLPHKDLLLARLYFDSGQPVKALDCLNNLNPDTLESNEQLLYYYRKGRIYQNLDKTEEAYKEFTKVIKYPFISQYEIPYSFLQIARILYANNQYSKAQLYLEKLLTFGNYPYKDGIRKKAKDLLIAIDEKSTDFK